MGVRFILLLIALVLFILAGLPPIARPWMIPAGLACLTGAMLAGAAVIPF